MKVARLAGAGAMGAAVVVALAAIAGSTALVIAGAAFAALAGAVVIWSLSDAKPATPAEPPRRAGKRADTPSTVLVATLRNVTEGSERIAADLQRVLAGIVADERGKIDGAQPLSLTAIFSRADHAVHAAQRILSNVDAVRARLGHDLRIGVAVHSGATKDEAVAIATKMQETASDAIPVLVSDPVARPLGNQLERVDTISGEGWQLDVFTFPPAQKRLPGF